MSDNQDILLQIRPEQRRTWAKSRASEAVATGDEPIAGANAQSHGVAMLIRKAEVSDAAAIAAIIVPTTRAGTTYSLGPDMSEAAALA